MLDQQKMSKRTYKIIEKFRPYINMTPVKHSIHMQQSGSMDHLDYL